MKNLQKGFVIPLVIIIVAIITAGGGGYYYVHNKQNAEISVNSEIQTTSTVPDKPNENTEGLKVYTNTKFGFNFKYPATDILTDDGSGNISLRAKNSSDGYLSINVGTKSIDETQSSLRIFEVPGRVINSKENITLNGVSWRKLLIANDQVFLLTYTNSQTYVIQYSTLSIQESIQNILSTFKFTSTSGINVSACATASDKDLCFTNLALSKNDVKICNSAHDKDFCIGRFGAEKGNVALCDSLPSTVNTQTKQLCYIGAAKVKKDVSICSKITPEWSTNVSACYIGVAEVTKDPMICKNYVLPKATDRQGTSQYDCFMKVAKASNDASLCSHITSMENTTDIHQQVCINWVTKNIDPYAVE